MRSELYLSFSAYTQAQRPALCLTGTVLITALLLIAQLGQVIAQQVQDHSPSQLPRVYFWVTPGTY